MKVGRCGAVSFISLGYRRGHNFVVLWIYVHHVKIPKDDVCRKSVEQAFVNLNVVSCSRKF